MSYNIEEGVDDAAEHLKTLQAIFRDHPRAYKTTFGDLSIWSSPDVGRDCATDVFWPAVGLGLYKSTDEYTIWPQDSHVVYLNLVMVEMQRREPGLYEQVVRFVKQFG